MNVRELHDAIAVEGFRQVGRGVFDMVYLQGLEATCHTISHQRYLQGSQHDADYRSIALIGQEFATEQEQQEGKHDEPHCDKERYGKTSNHRLALRNLRTISMGSPRRRA